MNRNKWVPTEQPWRVTWIMGSGYNAKMPVQTYATLTDAVAAFRGQRPSPAVHTIALDRALNPENWAQSGSWQRLAKRAFNQKAKVWHWQITKDGAALGIRESEGTTR